MGGRAVGVAVATAAVLVGVLGSPGLSSADPSTASSAAPSALGSGPPVRLSGNVPAVAAGTDVVGATDPSTRITVDVTLRPRDPSGLAGFARDVSTPGTADYHRYLSGDQLAATFGPTTAVVQATRRWLASTGLTVGPTTASGLIVPVTGTAAQLESTFAVPLVRARLADGRVARLTTREPAVPSTLAPSVQGVVGLSDGAVATPHLIRSAPLAVAAAGSGARPADQTLSGPQACPAISGRLGVWTATQLAQTYGISSLYGQGRTGAGQTVAIFELEPYTASDIAAYQECYGTDVPVTDTPVDGGPDVLKQSGEAALDIEMVAGLAPGASIDVYTGPDTSNGILDTYAAMVGSHDPAKVLTTSWGECEADADQTQGFLSTEAQLFQLAQSQGQTVLAASGDAGSSDCYSPSNGSYDQSLAVDDPASQPDVTGVGGTSLTGAAPGAPAEVVWNSGGGAGGGGSSQSAAPAWQQVSGARNGDTAYTCGTRGNQQCREVPDVSADADPQNGGAVYFEGQWGRYGGTSMAAPLWAAMIADIDQGCTTPAGFLNSRLYAPGATAGFNDVTGGGNNLFGNPQYAAGNGYDLASGWGSPKALALLGLLTAGCPSVTGVGPSTGPVVGGTTLTISGYDFGSGTPSVHVGGVPVAVQHYVAGTPTSPASVTVVTPAVATARTVAVAVTTAAGSSASTPVSAFTYYGPQVTAVAPPHGPVGGGATVTIEGAHFVGTTTVSFGGRPATGVRVTGPGSLTAVVPAGPSGGGAVDVTVSDAAGTSSPSVTDRYTYALPGYWFTASDGGIFAFGRAGFSGSGGGQDLGAPVVSMAPAPDDRGYWMATAGGGVFTYGDAGFHGSVGGQYLNRPIVGMAATPDGQGYWLVASDGGIFAFGDAGFYGSTGNLVLNRPIVGMAATPDGRGYWLVASDGGIFAFGDAGFSGSTGNLVLNRPIVGMATTPDGRGYWLVASDGGIFAFGDSGFHGSAGNLVLNRPVVGMATDLTGRGYWLVASDGGIFAFGDAGFYGSAGGLVLDRPIVGMAAT